MISRPQTAYSIGRRSRSPGRNPILCPPSWPGHTRAKSIQEKNIVDQKRYQENRTNRTISAHNFFENGTILAEKQDVWADSYISPKNQTKVSSLISTPNLVTPIPLGSENYEFSDYKMSKRPSTAGSVQTGFYSNMSDGSTLASNFSRKERLKMLLDEEDEAYKSYKQEEESTKELRKKQLKLLREKHAQRKKEKEEARKAKAAELMYEQFKKNCPQLRDIESSKLQEHVKTVWKDQIQEKDILRLEEEKERELEKQNMERMETARVETENRKKLEDIAAKKAIADALAFQLEELKTKNNEFKRLEHEKEIMILAENEYQKLQEQREILHKKHQNQKHAKLLWRQWKAQLRQRTLERQKELELDKQLLENLVAETAREANKGNETRRKLKEDILNNLQEIRARIKREQELEDNLDLMIRDTAEKVWAEREKIWETERQASQKLLNEVLSYQKQQMEEKLETNRQLQAETLKEKEQLLNEIELIKVETARDLLHKIELKKQEKLEREVEIREKQLEKLTLVNEEELADAELKQQHEMYNQLVEEEREKMENEVYVEKIYSKPGERPGTSQSSSSVVRFNIPESPTFSSSPQKSHRPTTADTTTSIRSRVTGPFIY